VDAKLPAGRWVSRVEASKVDVRVEAVDSNSIVPLVQLGPPVTAAAHLRPRLHRLFPEAFGKLAQAEPVVAKPLRTRIDPPFEPWSANDLDGFLATLPLDRSVPVVQGVSRSAGLMTSSALR